MNKIFIDLTWYQKKNIGFNNYIINLIKGFYKLKKKILKFILVLIVKIKNILKTNLITKKLNC